MRRWDTCPARLSRERQQCTVGRVPSGCGRFALAALGYVMPHDALSEGWPRPAGEERLKQRFVRFLVFVLPLFLGV